MSGTQLFLILFRNILCPRQMFPSLRAQGNVMSNNVSATMCPRLPPPLVRISSAHAIHWSRTCHVIFKRAHRVGNSTKYRADDLCVNLVCEYFCWTLGDPHFFFGRSLPFQTLSIILKNKKNLCVGSFNYFSYSF